MSTEKRKGAFCIARDLWPAVRVACTGTQTPAHGVSWNCALLQLPTQLLMRQHGTCLTARPACSGHTRLCKVHRSGMRCLTLAGDPNTGREAMKAARLSLTLLYRIRYDELYEYYQDFGGGCSYHCLLPSALGLVLQSGMSCRSLFESIL